MVAHGPRGCTASYIEHFLFAKSFVPGLAPDHLATGRLSSSNTSPIGEQHTDTFTHPNSASARNLA